MAPIGNRLGRRAGRPPLDVSSATSSGVADHWMPAGRSRSLDGHGIVSSAATSPAASSSAAELLRGAAGELAGLDVGGLLGARGGLRARRVVPTAAFGVGQPLVREPESRGAPDVLGGVALGEGIDPGSVGRLDRHGIGRWIDPEVSI